MRSFASRFALLAVASAAAMYAADARAVPATGWVEGAMSSAGGGPAADGSYAVTFAVYGQASGGTAVWTETGTISVKNGSFNWQLGSKVPLAASALNLPTPFLGVTVGNDPELPRQALGSVLYAQRAGIAESLECSGCIKATALDPAALLGYAKTGDLSGLAKTADLSAYAKTSDLDAYAKVAALAAVAASGSFNDLKDKPKLADVANSGAFGDLTGVPAMAKIGQSCGSGLLLYGFKADGALDCQPFSIPPDYIDEISNGLIYNQFVDKQQGGINVAIPDGQGAGVSNSLEFPDIGVAQAIWVDMDMVNSDVSKVKIELYGPGMGAPYILYDGSKSGQTLKVSFNKDTPLANGDMNKDWLGKNIKGTWSITVKDPLKNQLNATTDGQFTWSMSIKTLSNKKIQIKGDLIVDGNITQLSGSTGTLASRMVNKAGIVQGYDDTADTWRPYPGLVLPFTAVGGPVQVTMSGPRYGGSHSTCRTMIDGMQAGLYSNADTTYKWSEGLTYMYQPNSPVWRMWNPTRTYWGIAPGSHVITFDCLNDSTQGGPQIGGAGAAATAHVIPYGDPASAEIKVYSSSGSPNHSGGTDQWLAVPSLTTKFTAQGGPVRIALSVPHQGQSHVTCRPLIDNVPAATGDVDDLTYKWSEGLQYVGPQWNMWNRTRVYGNVAAGAHTLTVQCLGDSGTYYVGNGRMSAHATVVAYKANTDPTATAHVYWGSERKQYNIATNNTWTPLNVSAANSGLNAIKFTSTGGPVEIGISVPLVNGSHAACRANIDGNGSISGEPDVAGNYWTEGLIYTNGAWQMWDRVRLYKTIPAGNHVLQVECHNDSGSNTPQAGHPNMTSHAFVVAYDK